jgi:hypothetical protein
MSNILLTFIVLQIVLLFFMTFHDWVHLPPLTDIRELEKHSSQKGRLISSAIFFLIVFIPLLLTILYRNSFPVWALITIATSYGLLTVGTIFSWWVPYFFGSSEKHKADFAEYRNTHHFLPARSDNVIPNTFHVILHIQIWLCFGIALYLLINNFVSQ